MHLDSNKEQLSSKDLLPMVKQYLGSVLFKNVYQYETITNNHAKYLEFNVQRVPITQDDASDYKDIFVEDLLLGVNCRQSLNLQLLRVVQCNHVLVCFTIDELRPLSPLRNAVLVIVFPNKQAAKKWSQEHSYLTTIRIKNPFKSMHKFYTTLQFVLAHPENIEIKLSYNIANRQPEMIKNQANIKFRDKNYEEALLIYEIGMGFLHDSDKRRERAVFYANSSQCLYEMRLFQSALLYAEISIKLDRAYIKGLYRKLNCLLELDIKEIPRVISAISMMGSQSQVEDAQIKYTKYMANFTGIYDWMDIFESSSAVFGEYISTKLQFKKFSKRQNYLKAEQKINQFELILVHKPLIYKKSVQEKFGEEYTALTKQIETYARYEDYFYQKFETLPYQYLLHGQPLTFERSSSNESMEINEIHTICLRCLELQKTIENVTISKTEVLGIWQKLYAFKHECLANCTYIHIKGALVVFALKDIEKDEILSIDFLNWQTINRKNFMKEKLGRTCKCVFCCFEWQQYQHTVTPQILYQLLTSQKGTLTSREYDKINLYFMWELIFDKRYRELELMKEYLIILERYPIWQCIMNCLRYLRSRSKNDLFDLIKATLKRIFEKYFKINHTQAVKLLKSIL